MTRDYNRAMLFFEATQMGHAYCAISQRQRITNSRAGQKICTRSYGLLTICNLELRRHHFATHSIYNKKRLLYI